MTMARIGAGPFALNYVSAAMLVCGRCRRPRQKPMQLPHKDWDAQALKPLGVSQQRKSLRRGYLGKWERPLEPRTCPRGRVGAFEDSSDERRTRELG